MMTEIVVKIMAELLSVLALATKQIREGKISESILSDVNFWPNSPQRNTWKSCLGIRKLKRYYRD